MIPIQNVRPSEYAYPAPPSQSPAVLNSILPALDIDPRNFPHHIKRLISSAAVLRRRFYGQGYYPALPNNRSLYELIPGSILVYPKSAVGGRMFDHIMKANFAFLKFLKDLCGVQNIREEDTSRYYESVHAQEHMAGQYTKFENIILRWKIGVRTEIEGILRNLENGNGDTLDLSIVGKADRYAEIEIEYPLMCIRSGQAYLKTSNKRFLKYKDDDTPEERRHKAQAQSYMKFQAADENTLDKWFATEFFGSGSPQVSRALQQTMSHQNRQDFQQMYEDYGPINNWPTEVVEKKRQIINQKAKTLLRSDMSFGNIDKLMAPLITDDTMHVFGQQFMAQLG